MSSESIRDFSGDKAIENIKECTRRLLMYVTYNPVVISSIQWMYRLGYPKAARIMEELERLNIVSTRKGNKDRQLIMDNEKALEIIDYEKLLTIVTK